MIYLHTNFHVPRSSGSLVFIINQKVKYRFRSAAMLFIYNLFLKRENGYGIKFQETKIIGASIAPTSGVRTDAIFTLLVVRN
jgi:hypothetical protein